MVRFVMLLKYTEIGLSQVQNTTQRAGRFRADAEKMGIQVESLHWTVGAYDAVVILAGPDAETVVAFSTYASWQGYIRTQLMQAFDETQFSAVMERMPKRHPAEDD